MNNDSVSSFIAEPVACQSRRLSAASEEHPDPVPDGSSSRIPTPPDAPPSYSNGTPLTALTQTGTLTENHTLNTEIVSLRTRSPSRLGSQRQRAATNPSGQPRDLQNEPPQHSRRRHANTFPPLPPVAFTPDTGRSYNPSYEITEGLRPIEAASTSSSSQLGASAGAAVTGQDTGPANASREQDLAMMSSSLPADDGMRLLRQRIHEIRDMKVSNEEKASRMHSIMTERYSTLQLTAMPPHFPSAVHNPIERPVTPGSSYSLTDVDTQTLSPASSISIKPDNPFNITAADLVPCYQPEDCLAETRATAKKEGDSVREIAPARGCAHYKRNVKVQCFDCRRWYPCRHCHDASEKHSLDRRKTENMLCMLCQTPQVASDYCKSCMASAAWYYCDICKLWDDDTSKKIYHCLDCGICRRGEGLGKDYIHCKKCNVCISIAHADSHRCIERATDCDCPICGEYLFNSSTDVASMPCGHYMHKQCYDDYMQVAYKCPFCKKSVVNMELSWRKMTHAIESQPMPAQFSRTKVNIQCNDCSAKSCVSYHWLGNQCSTCDSYNTNEMQFLTEGDESHAVDVDEATSAGLEELRDQEIVRPMFEQQIPEQRVLEARVLESPRQRPTLLAAPSYFQSEREAVERRPSTAAMALEQLRLSPYEMLQRVSRSLSPIRAYLNVPQGGVLGERPRTAPENAVGYDENEVDFWGSDGRFLSGDEDEDDDEASEDDSSDDDGLQGADSDEEDESDGQPLDQLDRIPWHS